MARVIDDRNDQWYEFVKHVIEQEIPADKPIDELISEALQEFPPELGQTQSQHAR